jgi:hypothetical protein
VHRAQGGVAAGAGIAEGYVELVGGGLRRDPVQPGDHSAPLSLGIPPDWRSTADRGVQTPNLGGTPPRDERSEPTLEGELDNLVVGEQLEQERLHIVECGRPPEVHHDYTGLDSH